jgi:chemotaxis signal transduction protein
MNPAAEDPRVNSAPTGELALRPEWRAEWAERLAERPQATVQAAQRARWMVFGLGSMRCALPASLIVRTHVPGPTHQLPGRLDSLVPALVQLEGRLVLQADLFKSLGLPAVAPAAITRVLELQAQGSTYALPVCDVSSIADISVCAVEPAPSTLGGPWPALLQGLWRDDSGLVSLLGGSQLCALLDANLG